MCAVTCALLAALVVARSAAAQEPALRCRHERCRYNDTDYLGQDWYQVDGNKVKITHKIDLFGMDCFGAGVLESPDLPRAEPALHVSRVTLHRCPLPTAGSLADTLTALNVTLEYNELDPPRGSLTLLYPPAAPSLDAKHFAGLEHLIDFQIIGDNIKRPSPESGFLAPLRSLRSLALTDVVLPAGELDTLLLLKLELSFVNGVKQLPVTPTLEQLSVISRPTVWTEPRPAPLAHCDSLRILYLVGSAVNALPDGWLANCSYLETVEISEANHLTALPPKLLLGASALKQLSFKLGVLESLPAGLLDYSPNLRTLRLNGNRLRTLPSGTFGVAWQVRVLDLSRNELEGRVMDALKPLEKLTELGLRDNPHLGDVCGTDGYSLLSNSTQLKKLLLSATGITRICRDWREVMTLLEKLDLRRTDVSELSFEDLQFTRTVKAEVDLRDAPVTVVKMTREDYNSAVRKLSAETTVFLDAELECDCRMYWTRRALNLSLPALQHVDELFCNDGQLLRDVPPEDMVCARPEECAAAELPHACECSMWAADDPDHDPRLVRVRCERAALYSIPHLPDKERIYELLLAYNHIANIHTDDLPQNIKGLDLRNNSLKVLNEETARRLGDIDGMLHLSGNPLECTCHAAPLLRALHARNATQTDLSNATCSDGSSIYAAPIVDCSMDVSPAAWFAIVLGILLVVVVSTAACLGSRKRRFFVLAVLHRWGFEWRAAEPEEDDGRRYDAFMTFSHKDEAIVRELIAQLEPLYRLCLHYRDWTPGRFINEQIVESVHESRRTVALVSQHFLGSSWARAEFREAHAAAMLDARPRLIVVLLEEPAALDMDEQLRRYVTTQTYLRWGEPWFWDKLAVALPQPRTPRTPEPPSPDSPSALALELLSAPARTITETDTSV